MKDWKLYSTTTTISLPEQVVKSNLTNSSVITCETSICKLKTTEIVLIIGYILVFVIGVIGNGLVLVLFNGEWKKGSVINLLILYLALFDMLSSIFTPFVFGYFVWTCNKTWHFGYFGCKVFPVLSRIFTALSIGLLLIMAIDRCRIIVTPLKKRMTKRHVTFAVLVTLLLSLLSETHYIYSLEISSENGSCWVPYNEFNTYGVIVVHLCRDIIFSAIFILTTLAVTMKLNGTSFNKLSRGHSMQSRNRRRKKVLKMMVVMATVFGLTVIPRDLFHASFEMKRKIGNPMDSNKKWIQDLNNGLKLLQATNSIFNVFIYAGMHDKFWVRLRKLIVCLPSPPQVLYVSTTQSVKMKTSSIKKESKRITQQPYDSAQLQLLRDDVCLTFDRPISVRT